MGMIPTNWDVLTGLLDLRCWLFHRLSAVPRTGPEGTTQVCMGTTLVLGGRELAWLPCGRKVRSRVQFAKLELKLTDQERDFRLWEERMAGKKGK